MRDILIETRKNSGLTQEQVAKAVGVSYRYYQKLEAGICKPNVETAISIANCLNYKLADLPILFGTPRRQPGDTIAQGNFNTVSNHAIAAAELSEVPPSELVKAAVDLQDGRADTPAGARVLELMRQTGGAALA